MSPTPTKNTNDTPSDTRLNKRLKDSPIAIVGMASIFANARYLNNFWDLISEKIDAITDVPDSRWNFDDYYDADPSSPDKTYCKRGGFIPEVNFDPMEFGLPPNIVELTDTSQLLSLVIAKEVLADANIADDYDRDKIGITLGVGGGQKISHSLSARLQYPILKKVFKNSGVNDADSEMLIKKFQDQYIHWQENSFPGSLGNVIAGRIANRFDLGGMNCVVDAACAGSLAAMRLAISELTEGRSEMMITGGVCTDNSPSMYMSFSKTPAFTTNPTIQPFDIDSKGMMIGEGIGMIALKRLEDAERDGDRIYSVIKGIGASSDGKFKSIYAPRPDGQAKALKRAYDDAGFAAHTVDLIEAHGTGTAAGDLAEFNGLKSVFTQDKDHRQHIALGSVKSQIGHTKSTAGTAGVIKAALALHHKVLPATINVSQPNPKLAIENSPFYINSETRPWLPQANGTPRRAGISSFGFGGTNFHLVLEEYQAEHQRDNDNAKLSQYRQRKVSQSLLFSASSKTTLITQLNEVINASHNQRLADIAEQYAPRVIAAKAPRLGIIATSKEQLIQLITQAITKLQQDEALQWSLADDVYYRSQAIIGVDKNAKVAAVFAGQGSQYLNMGRELGCNFPEFRRQFVQADKVFASHDKTPISHIVYPTPAFDKATRKTQETKLTNTANSQSAIGAVTMGQYAIITAAGFKPDMVAGHSFGELSALYAADVIDIQTYYELAFARGDAMAANDKDSQDNGVMYAVIIKANTQQRDDALGTIEKAISNFDGVKIANYNAPTQWVIAGATAATNAAAKALDELGFNTVLLPVSGAFHTQMVEKAQTLFAQAIADSKFTSPKYPIYTNTTGDAYPKNARSIKDSFKQHMLQPVRFSEQIDAMYAQGARVFVEFGPKSILQKLIASTLNDHHDDVSIISINPQPKTDDDRQLRRAAMQMIVTGINLENLDPYAAQIAPEKQPSAMNIKLSASNYISPATREKMAQSLQSGKISTPISPVETPILTKHHVKKVEKVVKKITPTPENQNALEQFFNSQNRVAELHQQFLNIPQQYGETFTNLMTAQANMASAGIEIPSSLSQSMDQFNQLQAQILKSHSQFLDLYASGNHSVLAMLNNEQLPASGTTNTNTRITPSAMSNSAAAITNNTTGADGYTQPQKVVTQQPQQVTNNQVTPAFVPTQQTTNIEPTATLSLGKKEIEHAIMVVVADKTGYPSEMLDLSMDMEADLGIDSIKRVEILGAVQDTLADLPELDPDALAECRTLGEIVTYMESTLEQLATEQAPKKLTPIQTQTAVPTSVSAAAPPATTVSLSASQLQDTMMTVVADKTGYPSEMLDLSMDMEADLGIDSIKRVEILGAVQDTLTDLPELDPDALSECRTLGEIVSYMESTLEQPISAQSIKEPAPIQTQAVAPTEAPTSLSASQLQDTMMTVVADKTGYPSEMLELSMDMEADLGIDSIKRVEILGAVQDTLTDLPELDPDALSECRTLGEIVTYMESTLAQPINEQSTAEQTIALLQTPAVTPIEQPPHEEVSLKKLNAANKVDHCFAANANVIVTDDGQTTAALAEKLTTRGINVAVVQLAGSQTQSQLKDNIACFKINSADEAAIKTVIGQITTHFGAIDGFIHLHPKAEFVNPDQHINLDADSLNYVNQVFLCAKLLQPFLTKTSEHRRCFITVAHIDGGFGYNDHVQIENAQIKNAELNQTALFGLTKTLSHEWPMVFCRTLDIAPNITADHAANGIVAELFDSQTALIEVGLSLDENNSRDLHRLTLVAGKAKTQAKAAKLDSDDNILVTGGAKGVTFSCALTLAKHAKCHFILAGRSDHINAKDIPTWAQNKTSTQLKQAAIAHLKTTGEKPTPKLVETMILPINNSLKIDAAIDAFNAIGASAQYLCMDVSDPQSIATALTTLSPSLQITGIIHGAGVLNDNYIEHKNLAEFDRVYATKVGGLNTLFSHLNLPTLKLVALFSSAAGFYGNAGQSDYSMANDILNKTALQLFARHPNTKAISFNWGPWDGGMVTPALKKMFTERGVYVIPINEGAELFATSLAKSGGVQLLVGTDMQGGADDKDTNQAATDSSSLTTKTLTRQIDPKSLALLQDHRIGDNPVLPTICATQWMRSAAHDSFGTSVKIIDYKLLKGVIFTTDAPQLLSMTLIAQHQDGALKTIEAAISCGDQLRYRATLKPDSTQTGTKKRFDNLLANTPITQKDRLYYDGTLFHGSRFQGLDKVLAFDKKGLVASCKIPTVADADCGDFIPETSTKGCQPFAEDLLLQAMLVWSRLTYGAASLPSSIGELRCYSPMKANERGFVELEVIKASNHTLQADVALYHQNGDLSVTMKAVTVTISKNLNDSFMAKQQLKEGNG